MSAAGTDLEHCKTTNPALRQARECVREAMAVLRKDAPHATAIVIDPGPHPTTLHPTVRVVQVCSDVGALLLAEPAASGILDLVELHLTEALSYVSVDTLTPQRDGCSRYRRLSLPPFE